MVDVVIPSWNGRLLLEDCLSSLRAQTMPPSRTIVVDNASTDGTAEWLAAGGADVEVVRLEANLGFAGAVNRGLARAATEVVAVLNNDARPHPGWLEAASAVFHHPAVGSCACVVLTPQGRVESAGLRWTVWGVARRNLEGRSVEDLPPSPVEVFGASAGAALYRREALERVGGFDETFFAQDEDIDLAFRLREEGYVCLLHPGAVVTHLGGCTLKRNPERALWLAQRNLEWVFWTHTPRASWPVLGALHVAYQACSLLRHAATGRGALVWDAKRQAVAGLRARRRGRARWDATVGWMFRSFKPVRLGERPCA